MIDRRNRGVHLSPVASVGSQHHRVFDIARHRFTNLIQGQIIWVLTKRIFDSNPVFFDAKNGKANQTNDDRCLPLQDSDPLEGQGQTIQQQ